MKNVIMRKSTGRVSRVIRDAAIRVPAIFTFREDFTQGFVH